MSKACGILWKFDMILAIITSFYNYLTISLFVCKAIIKSVHGDGEFQDKIVILAVA